MSTWPQSLKTWIQRIAKFKLKIKIKNYHKLKVLHSKIYQLEYLSAYFHLKIRQKAHTTNKNSNYTFNYIKMNGYCKWKRKYKKHQQQAEKRNKQWWKTKIKTLKYIGSLIDYYYYFADDVVC